MLPNHSMMCLPPTCPASQPASQSSVHVSITLQFICFSIKPFIHTSIHLSSHPPHSFNLHQAIPLSCCLFSGKMSVQNHKQMVMAVVGMLQRLPMGTQWRTVKFVFSSSVLENDPAPHLSLTLTKIINPSIERWGNKWLLILELCLLCL